MPSLELYLDMHRFAGFISFLKEARKCGILHIKSHFDQFKRVVQFFMARDCTQVSHSEGHDMIVWAERLKGQLSYSMPRPSKDPQDLADKGEWMDSSEIIKVIEIVKDIAMDKLETHGRWVLACVAGWPCPLGVWHTHLCMPCRCTETAWLLHEAAKRMATYGHMPPLRPSVLISLQHPSCTKCQHPGCKDPDCKGNRVEKTETGGHHCVCVLCAPRPIACMHAHTPSLHMCGCCNTGGYKLVVVHHKNARRKKWGPLQFKLPDDVVEYLGPHIEWGHKLITTSPFLFVASHSGKRFTLESFCQDFRTWISNSTGACFGPQRLRHIFITERMDDPDGPGPSNKGAAMVSLLVAVQGPTGKLFAVCMTQTHHPSWSLCVCHLVQVMGNSLDQWHRSYDLNFARRLAQPAVDAMPKWRAAQLDKAGWEPKAKPADVLAARRRQWVLFESDDEVESEAESDGMIIELESASDSDDE